MGALGSRSQQEKVDKLPRLQLWSLGAGVGPGVETVRSHQVVIHVKLGLSMARKPFLCGVHAGRRRKPP